MYLCLHTISIMPFFILFWFITILYNNKLLESCLFLQKKHWTYTLSIGNFQNKIYLHFKEAWASKLADWLSLGCIQYIEIYIYNMYSHVIYMYYIYYILFRYIIYVCICLFILYIYIYIYIYIYLLYIYIYIHACILYILMYIY